MPVPYFDFLQKPIHVHWREGPPPSQSRWMLITTTQSLITCNTGGLPGGGIPSYCFYTFTTSWEFINSISKPSVPMPSHTCGEDPELGIALLERITYSLIPWGIDSHGLPTPPTPASSSYEDFAPGLCPDD